MYAIEMIEETKAQN